MTANEIEGLCIRHADDFRAISGLAHSIACDWNETWLSWPIGGGSWGLQQKNRDVIGLPSVIAVAAFTEFWRDRLDCQGYRLIPKCYMGRRGWVVGTADDPEGILGSLFYMSVPEAICGVVQSLAREKQKVESAKGYEPSPEAVSAAEEIRLFYLASPAEGLTTRSIAAMIDMRFRKEKS